MAFTSPKMGLKVWNQAADVYDHDQLADNWSKVDLHDHTLGRGVQIPTEGIADGAITNSKLSVVNIIAETQLTNALGSLLGITQGATTRRGKSIIATTESRTNVAYGTLTTPDQVSVTLPTDGLLFVAYQATWQNSVSSAGRAAIFLGANQLQGVPISGPTYGNQQAGGSSNTGTDVLLSTTPLGLQTNAGSGLIGVVPTTGAVLGAGYGAQNYGLTTILAAAGSYAVSVQYSSTSGSVTVKNRQLWVWTIGFG